MQDDATRYLTFYSRVNRIRAGILASPATMLRDRLDAKAHQMGHHDRFSLFLPRAATICGLAIDDCHSVMELGAGNGWALRYRKDGLKRIAVDAAANFASEFARDGVEFHAADISRDRLPATDGAIDLIMMNHVIEHVADPTHLLSECRRVLRKGGAVYLRTPDVERVGHRFWDDYTHVKPYTRRSLPAVMGTFGFELRELLASDYTRICLDMLTEGRFRKLIFRGGKEIEAAFLLPQ
jgi:SAM-dependent methyltransferase